MTLRPFLAIFLMALFLVYSKETTSQPTFNSSIELAKWIMDIVIKRGQENERIKRASITYNKNVVKSDLKKSNSNQVIETSLYQVYGRDDQSWERLVERDSRSIKNSRPEKSNLNFNIILLERYNFNLEREEFNNSKKDGLVAGRGYYVISFKPKEPINKLPFEERLDEGFNRAAGYIYIDMEKFYLKRMEGKLTNSFSKGLNIFEMKDFTLIFEQEEFEGVIVPSSLILTYKYRVFWGNTYEKLEYTYDNRKITTYSPRQ